MTNSSDSELERLRKKKLEEMRKRMSSSNNESLPTTQGDGVVQHLTTQTFDQAIQEGITLVDFKADWCGPCKIMAPIVTQLAKEYAGKAKVAEVDVDESIEIAMRFQIRGVPTFGIFKNGQLIQRIVGGVGYQPLKTALDMVL
jgi:thioredoxin 1